MKRLLQKYQGAFLIIGYLLFNSYITDPLFELQTLQSQKKEGEIITMAKIINPPENLWKGLIGEASNQGPAGMYAVAMCVKNRLDRGLPIGLSSLRRSDLDKIVAQEGPLAELRAKCIVNEVFYPKHGRKIKDVTNKATHFENLELWPEPEWVKKENMIFVAKIGDHTFWKKPEGKSVLSDYPSATSLRGNPGDIIPTIKERR